MNLVCMANSLFRLAPPLFLLQPTSRPASSRVSAPVDERGETPFVFTPLSVLKHMQRTFILREVLLRSTDGEIRVNKNPPRLYFHENLFK